MKRTMNGRRLAMKVAHTMMGLMACLGVAGMTDSTKFVTLTLMLAMVYVTLVWDD